MMMSHTLRRKIALMHALRTVPARRPTILVDALSLAFATAHTGTAGSE